MYTCVPNRSDTLFFQLWASVIRSGVPPLLFTGLGNACCMVTTVASRLPIFLTRQLNCQKDQACYCLCFSSRHVAAGRAACCVRSKEYNLLGQLQPTVHSFYTFHTLSLNLPVHCDREEEKRLAATASPDVHTLLSAGPRGRQGGTVGISSARRKVPTQREPRESLPSIVGSNRGHHDKDAADTATGHTHHLPGTVLQALL